ncbi:hypothetical protein [Erythrobacter sp. CCH5-A1]|jgi:hypothetical protein|uniref:hypothetical protein n=1 Tax=Erythrobacter sp. CCH5-A1 TaxID=1768792 RepID=UPI00082D1B08|nr:hypothetical protein [Erythrobacter sp. CCH5-A1]
MKKLRNRLLVTGVIGAVVLTGCADVKGNPANTQAEVEQENADSVKMAGAQKAMAVDPLTAVSAGLSIASSLKSLFGKDSNQRDLKEIKRKLNEISAQNSQILQRLGEIMSILQNLGAIIRENVRLETIYEKQARLSGESSQLYETWLAEIDDRRARRQAENRYRNDILPDVRDVTSQLMDEGYGYSAYDTVGHGMLMEFWMSRRLGERASLRRTKAGTFLEYFDRALNPAVAGSLGKLLAEAKAQQARLKAVLDAADQRIGADGWEVAEREYQTSRSSGRRTTYKKIRVLVKASGNQTDGYVLSRREVVLREWVEVEPPERTGPCPACKNIEAASESTGNKSLPPDPIAGADNPVARVSYWNAVRSTLAQADNEVVLWSKTSEVIRIYRAEAKAVAAGG